MLPVDSSEMSKKAVLFAMNMFADSAELTLLHVIHPIPSERVTRYVGPHQIELLQREEADHQLVEVKDVVEQGNTPYELRIEFGEPATTISTIADQQADLVVMGTHGYGRVSGYLLGSMSYKTLANVHKPVVLVPKEADVTNPVKQILVAVDGSDHARRALDEAIHLAKRTGAHITLATVVTPPVAYTGISVEVVSMVDQEELLNIGKEILTRYENVLIDYQVPYSTRVEVGYPAYMLRQIADETQADLIALGHHGLNWMAEAIMGSVTYKMIHGTKTPLLIVK
ncbi:universal stress protein [Brevibacillus dissolubilis]|uniref:universal stress protein n=1 Tax=Brevibacillus dissolubilis TaxID=1844116 RepID=UPI002100113A|nr:universal stress protein [Brevibacillus dissolubilis]